MSSGNETIVKVKHVHIVGGHAAVDVDAWTNAFTSNDLQYFNIPYIPKGKPIGSIEADVENSPLKDQEQILHLFRIVFPKY